MEAVTLQLQQAIDELAAASPSELAGTDAIVELHRQLDRLTL